jgi:hypothetical protein
MIKSSKFNLSAVENVCHSILNPCFVSMALAVFLLAKALCA